MKLQTFAQGLVFLRIDYHLKLQSLTRSFTHQDRSILKNIASPLTECIMMGIMSLTITLYLAIYKEKQLANTLQMSNKNDLSLFQETHSQDQVITFLTGTEITLHHGNSLSTQLLEQ